MILIINYNCLDEDAISRRAYEWWNISVSTFNIAWVCTEVE